MLASSGVTGPGATEVLDAVEWVLLAVRLGRMDAAENHQLPPAMQGMRLQDNENEGHAPAEQAAAAPAAAVGEASAVGPQATAAGTTELHVVAGQDVETEEFDPEDVERIKALNMGAWVEFVDEAGEPIPAKLSWISPISSRLLFVTRRGMRHCAASPQELAVMIKQGKLHLRIGDSAFENAMTQVLGRLREAAPKVQSAG